VSFGGGVPGAPARLEAYTPTQLDSVAAGANAGPAQVRVLDANDAPVPNASVNWTATGGGTVPPVTLTGASGVASGGTWQTGASPGVNTATATLAAVSGAPAVTFTVRTLTAGVPAAVACAIAFVCGPRTLQVGAVAGDGVGNVVAIVTDAAGLVVRNVPVTITGNGLGNRTNPALPVTLSTNANGIVSLSNWRLDTLVRSDTIMFAVAGLPPLRAVTSGVPLAASRLRPQFPAASLAGQPIAPAPTVRVTDIYGNLVSTATTPISLAIANGPQGGVLSGTLSANAVNGVATFPNVIASIAGNYTINASAPGLASSTMALLAQGISVTPASVVATVGTTTQLIPSFVGIPQGTVTFASFGINVAAVSATGLVTGVAPGSTTIRVTYTADVRITADVPVTVTAAPPPFVSINSVLVSGGSTPVALNSIVDVIDVLLTVQPNNHVITNRVLLIDGIEVAQSPGNVLTLDTAEIDPQTDMLRFCNGPHTMAARVFWQGGPPAGVTSQVLNVSFNNNGSC
jgi:hypothetical protein